MAVGGVAAGGTYVANLGNGGSADNDQERPIDHGNAPEPDVEMAEAVVVAEVHIQPLQTYDQENGDTSDTAQELTAENFMRYS